MGNTQQPGSGDGYSGFRGVIGGSGRNDGRPEEGGVGKQALAPCPCGADAVWYRIKPPSTPTRGRAFGNLTADDMNDNLCDACYLLAVSEELRSGWKRLDTEHKIDQDRYGTAAFDPGQMPDGWDDEDPRT